MATELERYAKILAEWGASLPLRKIYIFGSRVRGDATENSDLDVALEFDPPTQVDDRMWNWTRENGTNFSALRKKLGVPLSLHADKQDTVWPAIRAAAAQPLLSIGIVYCVITPRIK
jgi:predicted nucleotidyltransferase